MNKPIRLVLFEDEELYGVRPHSEGVSEVIPFSDINKNVRTCSDDVLDKLIVAQVEEDLLVDLFAMSPREYSYIDQAYDILKKMLEISETKKPLYVMESIFDVEGLVLLEDGNVLGIDDEFYEEFYVVDFINKSENAVKVVSRDWLSSNAVSELTYNEVKEILSLERGPELTDEIVRLLVMELRLRAAFYLHWLEID